jgi:aerobic-type carbon monoxide dehydrogenase small subunit (CoxS/CutS family)
LSSTLRYKLGLTGTKPGCDRAECGACTVLIDDIPYYSCSVLTHRARPEGFDHRRTDPRRRNLASGMQGVIDEPGFQSAFCMPGFARDAQKTFQLPRLQQASRSPMSRWHAGGSGMGLDINNLWRLRDEDEWLDALDRYWVNPTVCKNRYIEQFMPQAELG